MEENQETQNSEIKNRKPMNPILLGGIAIVVLLVVGGFLFSQRRNQPVSDVMPATDENVQGVETEVDNAIVKDALPTVETEQVINIEAGSFYYSQKEIRVKKGQTVKIVLTAKDMMHDFNIDELEVDGPIIKAGESTTIEFVADRVGEFEYYCSVGQHRQNGQVGKLIIEE